MTGHSIKHDNDKVLLLLLPFWTPLIPPQGICRIKGFLQSHGWPVKTVDVNLDSGFKTLYDKYFNTLTSFIPENRWGNLYNIGNDVWREHMMAHINYGQESEYIELVKLLIYKVFYLLVDNEQVQVLNNILTAFYGRLKLYILDLLAREKPGVLGISVYRDTLPASLFVFRLTRETYPHIRTVMGGSIFSIQLVPGSPNLEFFLQKTRDYIDNVIIGEGELLLLKLLQGRLTGNQRLFTRQDIGGELLGFPPIEMYDFSDFDFRHYYYLAVQGSASCPNRCSFCNVASFYGEYRQKDPARIVEEMTFLYNRCKTRLFFMLDAMVNEFASELAGELLRSPLALYWDGYWRVNEAACHIENVLLWRRGGFYRARIGMESGSQRVLDLMGKNITLHQIKQNLSNLAHCGIKTTVYIVIGHPGETEDDFQQTLDLLEELKNDIWEAECNPFTYFYNGQAQNHEWAKKRILLYPQSARDMLINQTWIVNGQPYREEMYARVFRFVEHCKKLGISTPWTLKDVNRADQRWKKLHKNAVPSLLELSKKEQYNDECKHININQHAVIPGYTLAEDTQTDDADFDF